MKDFCNFSGFNMDTSEIKVRFVIYLSLFFFKWKNPYFFQMEKYKDDRSRTLFIYYSEEGIFLNYFRLSSRVYRIFIKVGRNAFKVFDHFFHTVNETLSLFCIGFKEIV